MTIEQIVKKALAEIEMAEVYISQASESYKKAKKMLESIYTPPPVKKKKGLSEEEKARLIANRERAILRSLKKH